MSTRQKLKYLIYFITALILNGCCCGGDSSVYKFYNFYKVLKDENNTFYLKANYNFDDENQTFYLKQDKETYQWREVNVTSNLENREKVSFVSNNVILKDKNNEIIYKDTLPNIEEISDKTDMEFVDATVVYHIFGKKYANWNRKQIIASIGIGKYSDKDVSDYLYKKVYNFMLTKNNGKWDIQYINSIEDNDYGISTPFLSPIFTGFNQEEGYIVSPKQSLFCYEDNSKIYWERTEYAECFVENENDIVVKSLYGDIYPQAYYNVLQKYMDKYKSPSPLIYFFDKNSNMHIFYNDTSHAKGKYFNYVMFSKDEPNIPKYEQKIERR